MQGMRLNILFLSEIFYPQGGGAELATYLYAKLLAEKGIGVSVMTNTLDGEESFSKVEGFRVYRRSLHSAFQGKYATVSRPDVLLSSFTRKLIDWADIIYIPRFWYSAIPWAKAYGKPVITHLHDYIPICPMSNLYNVSEARICQNPSRLSCSPECIYAFERSRGRSLAETLGSVVLNSTLGRCLGRLVALSDKIICVSVAQRNLIIARIPSLASKTCVIYNPLPKLLYTEIKGDDFGYFGGPHFNKGFHVLRRALAITRDERIKVHATKFPNATASSSLYGRQFLLYDKLGKLRFERLWAQIRAILAPSIWHEPLPYVVSEAILRGRIVVASNVGGIPEQVEGCEGNLLCKLGSFKQLAEALDYVRGLDREEVVQLGIRNRVTFLKRYSNKIIIQKFIEICEKLA